MSDSEIASKLVIALGAHADQAMADATAIVSVTIDMLGSAGAGEVKTRLTRKTRTLAFLSAEFIAKDGMRTATASSVHKIEGR